METGAKKNWWQGSWPIPLSVALHVLIVAAFYFQWPGGAEAPAEPESVTVELVEPPKEEPPKQEEKKAEEPPPPPAEEKAEEPPPPPPQAQTPLIAMRPDKTQLDERDEPGKQEETGGQEQPKPAEEVEASPPEPKPVEETQKDETPLAPASNPATADQGEIPAVEADAPTDTAAVAVPTPKPDAVTKQEEVPKTPPDGVGDPNLKPAKKLLASGTRPRPMLRQILGNLPPVERVAQLCMAEVTAQINEERRGQTPFEGLQPHTGRNFPIVGNIMDARGAFNVGPQWFPVNYRCEVDIDNYIVTDFRYDIGGRLSADDVKRLRLPKVY